MARIARGTITFIYNMDEDPLFDIVEEDWTDEKKIEYFTECMAEDIAQASFGDISPYIEMTIEEA